MVGLPTPEEVARDLSVCQTQTYLGHEALRQAHLPIREGGLGLTSSDAIKGAAYIGCQALVLGRVVAASARGNLSSLLERLPERPTTSALIDELKTMSAEVGKSKLDDVVGASWAALAAGEDPHRKGIGTLLVEVGATGGVRGDQGGRGREGRGEGDGGTGDTEEHTEREDQAASQPERGDERTQNNRSARRECLGIKPRVQSKLSRVLHARRGAKLLEDIRNQDNYTMKRAMVQFRGAREKGAMAFVECLGVSREDTMEGSLWRETLGRSLGSHDAVEPIGGTCHGNGCRKETTRLHAISCTKTGWSSLTHNRVLHHALAKSLRESKVQFVIEDTWPFRQVSSGEHIGRNPLRMDATTEAGALFGSNPRRKDKALLLDLTIVNPCVSSNLENSAREAGKHLTDAVERKNNKYRGSFPATYSLLPLAMSTCGEVSPDVHALYKELAIRRVEHSSEVHTEESRRLAEGVEIARLRRRFSFVLQQALSFRTRHHLCRQGVTLGDSHQVCPQDRRPKRREGRTSGRNREREEGETDPINSTRNTSRVVDLGERFRRGDVMLESSGCNDSDEEGEGGVLESRKRKRRESVSPVSRLIKSFRDCSSR